MLTVSSGAPHIPPIEAGSYPAICYGVIDLGEQVDKKYNNVKRKVMIMWEIPDLTIDLGNGDVPRTISKKFTASLGERAKLREALESWRSKSFTEEESRKFDLQNIIGAPCMLGITQDEYKGNKYAKILSITPLPKQIPAPEGTLDKISFDLDIKEDLKKLDLLPEWIVNQIKESPQYKRLVGAMPPPPESIDDLDLPTEPDDEVPF